MPVDYGPVKGRGAIGNPRNRFLEIEYIRDPECDPADETTPSTQLLEDSSKSILSTNDSPDVGFDVSVNVYRGCEHGCSYCYARPTHEYFGFSAGLDFETKILVKTRAPELLRQALGRRSWKPQVIAMSGVSDPYQPVEKRLRLTRGCLEVLRDFGNPVQIITKNALAARDVDILGEMADRDLACVTISVTSLDPEVIRKMEPRTAQPSKRLEAVRLLSEAGVPVKVNIAPVVPGLTDHEMPLIVEAAAEHGAQYAGFLPLRLPHGVKDLFQAWLAEHYADRKQKVLNRVRSMRGGQLNDTRFGSRMRGEGLWAELYRKQFEVACRKHGLSTGHPVLATEHFRVPTAGEIQQLALFE